jgi:hypothetical protein
MPENNKTADAAMAAVARAETGQLAGVEPVGEPGDAPLVPAARGGQRQLFDPVRQSVFIEAMKEKPIVGRAARKAGITVATCYAMRKRSASFAAAWDEALIQSVDEIDGEVIRRGMAGSDRLLIEAARAHRPEKYSPKLDVDVAGRVEIVVDLVPGRFVADVPPRTSRSSNPRSIERGCFGPSPRSTVEHEQTNTIVPCGPIVRCCVQRFEFLSVHPFICSSSWTRPHLLWCATC